MLEFTYRNLTQSGYLSLFLDLMVLPQVLPMAQLIGPVTFQLQQLETSRPAIAASSKDLTVIIVQI